MLGATGDYQHRHDDSSHSLGSISIQKIDALRHEEYLIFFKLKSSGLLSVKLPHSKNDKAAKYPVKDRPGIGEPSLPAPPVFGQHLTSRMQCTEIRHHVEINKNTETAIKPG